MSSQPLKEPTPSPRITPGTGRHPAPPTPTPRVQHLEFANPLEVILLGGIAIAGAVGYVVTRISNAVASAAEAASKVQAVGHERNEEQRRGERHQLEMRSLQLDNLKQAVELSDVLERIHPAIREIAGVEIPELSPGQQARAEGLKDQAVEARYGTRSEQPGGRGDL